MKKTLMLAAGILALGLTVTGCGGKKDPAVTEPTFLTAPPSVHTSTPSVPVANNTRMLLSTADPVTDMDIEKREHYDNGTYRYWDKNSDGSVQCISSCYVNTIRSDETEEDYATRRAVGMSVTLTPGSPYNLAATHNQELSDALGYPVYLVSYFTGSDQNLMCWTIYLTHTEDYSYQYAFTSTAEQADLLEDAFTNYFATLKLVEMPQ